MVCKIIELKICCYCKQQFNQKKYSSGRLEGIKEYLSRKYCSKECFSKFNSKENNHNWKGGIRKRPDGYLRYSNTDVYVHRKIMEEYLGRPLEKHEHVHHKDGNTSNNVLSNLELLTHSQHAFHHAVNRKTKARSGYRGVTPNGKGWTAKIKVNGQQISLGTYKNKEIAALAYNEAALKYFGSFAVLNKVNIYA